MKRHVRIYKPMSQFEEGGQPTPDEITDEQILKFILQELSMPDGTIEDAQQKLVQSDIDPNRVMKLSQAAIEYLQEQQTMKNAQVSEDQDAITDLQADQQIDEAQMQEQAEKESQMYESQIPDIDEGVEDESAYMKQGGISKRDFIKTYISSYKKAEGGNTADDTDIPIDGRAEQLQKFLGAVKNTAQDAAIKDQAEQAYDNYMQEANSFELPEEQFGGGLFGRNARRAARKLEHMMPMQGMSPLMQFYPGIANIDVHKRGLFGRPKQYTINFNGMPFNPMMFNTTQPAAKKIDYTINPATGKPWTTEEWNTIVKSSTGKEEEVKPNQEQTTTTESTDKPISFSNSTQATSSNTPVKRQVSTNRVVNTSPVVTEPVVAPETSEKVINYGANPQYSKNAQGNLYYNPNKPGIVYTVGPNGEYMYGKQGTPSDQWKTITDKTRIGELNKELKGSSLWTLDSKPGYYYRQRNDGSYAKFEGDPKNHTQNKKSIAIIKPGDKNYTYLNKNAKFSNVYSKQMGGMTDQQSGLYKFFGGGEEQIDYTDSKNVNDPYFAYGGYLHKAAVGETTGQEPAKIDYTINPVTKKQWTAEEWEALGKKKEENKSPFTAEQEEYIKKMYGQYPATQQTQTTNPYLYNKNALGMFPFLNVVQANRPVSYDGSWNKMVGVPYSTGTDNPFMGHIDQNTILKSIDVHKRGMFGAPKKYTLNFGNYDPTKPMIGQNQQSTESTGPGVSPDADKYDGIRVGKAKRLAKHFETPDTEDIIKMSGETPKQSVFDLSAVSRSQGKSLSLPIDNLLIKNQQIPEPSLQVPSKYKNLITPGPSQGFSADPYSVMPNPGNVVLAPRTNKGEMPINYSGPMNIPQSVTEQAFGFAYGGYLPQAQTGNFPPVQGFYKDTRKNKSATSYNGPRYNLPAEKNIPSETTQKVGQYTKSVGADKQRGSELRMQAAKNLAAQNARKQGTDYNTALANANRQVQSTDFNPGEYLQREEQKNVGSGPASSATVKAYTPQSDSSRAWEYITNPLTAAEYAISGGGAENMPHNINAMRMAGIDPGVVQGRNLVGNTLNTNVNALDAADKVVGNIGKGNYLTAGAEALRLIPAAKAIKTGAQEFGALVKSGALGDVASIAEGITGAGQTAAGAMHLHGGLDLLKEKAIHSGAHEVDHALHQIFGGLEHHAYGGFIPTAQDGLNGIDSSALGPQVYTTNPENVGMSDLDLTQSQTSPIANVSNPNVFSNIYSAFSNKDVPVNNQKITDPTAAATMNLNIDPNQQNRQTIKKNQAGDFSMDVKRKDQYTIDPLAALNVFNAGANSLLGFVENNQQKRAQGRMIGNLTADNQNAVSTGINRGTYDVNSGLLGPDEMGFTGVVKYGGPIYQEGGEAYLTDEEIEDFLANGGELEYLND